MNNYLANTTAAFEARLLSMNIDNDTCWIKHVLSEMQDFRYPSKKYTINIVEIVGLIELYNIQMCRNDNNCSMFMHAQKESKTIYIDELTLLFLP